MNTDIYNLQGKKQGNVALPEAVMSLPWNADLVHQVVTAIEANTRLSTAHTKMRGEVSGTGRKPWKQKGTGQARHGSRRSPIWRTGGVSHGPRNEKDYSQKINKKMLTKALLTTWAQKIRDGQVLFTTELALDDMKTKSAEAIISALSQISGFETIMTPKANNVCVILPERNETIQKAFRNLPYATIDIRSQINPRDILHYRYIIVASAESFPEYLSSKLVASPVVATVSA